MDWSPAGATVHFYPRLPDCVWREVNLPTMRSAILKGTCCLQVPRCFGKNAISGYLTLHHQARIPISWEGMATKPIFMFQPKQPAKRIFGFPSFFPSFLFIPVKDLSFVPKPRGRHGVLGFVQVVRRNKMNVTARLNCDILSGDLSPLANYPTLIQLLHAGHPDIHRLTRPAGLSVSQLAVVVSMRPRSY